MLVKTIITALMALSTLEPLLAIPADIIENRQGCFFFWSDQGVCSLCSNTEGTELTITNCGEKQTVTHGCYNGTSLSVCISGCPADNNALYPTCYVTVNDVSISILLPTNRRRFSCPIFEYLNCEHLSVSFCEPDNGLFGTCKNHQQQQCSFYVLAELDATSPDGEQVLCPKCVTTYGKSAVRGSVIYGLKNETSITPYPGCASLKPAASGILDADSLDTARDSLVLFLAVEHYLTEDGQKEHERPLTDSPLPCKGVRIHNNYVLTSDHCGQSLSNWLMARDGNGTDALIKVFSAGRSEGVGYITPESAFHFSNAYDEAGMGDGVLIVLNTPVKSSQFPEYRDQSPNLSYRLYLLSATSGKTSTSSNVVTLDSSRPKLYEVTFLESSLDPWGGEPVFWLNHNQKPPVLDLVGWVDISREGCGYNFNEDCVSPVTASVEGWIDYVLRETPDDGALTTMPTTVTAAEPTRQSTVHHAGHPANSTAAGETTGAPPSEPKPNYILEIVVPIAASVASAAVAVSITMACVCVCIFKVRKRGQIEMVRFE